MTIDDCIRDVVGYEGKYKINIVGEVFNKKWKQLKPCVDKFGYLKCGKLKQVDIMVLMMKLQGL